MRLIHFVGKTIHLNFTIDIDGEIKITHQSGGNPFNLDLSNPTPITGNQVRKYLYRLLKHPDFFVSEYGETDVEVKFIENEPTDVKFTVRELDTEPYSYSITLPEECDNLWTW